MKSEKCKTKIAGKTKIIYDQHNQLRWLGHVCNIPEKI